MRIFTLFRTDDDVDLVFMLSEQEAKALLEHKSGIVDLADLDPATSDRTIRNIIFSCPDEQTIEQLTEHQANGMPAVEFVDHLYNAVHPDMDFKPTPRPSQCRHKL